jgi:hypothetical protein
MYYHQCGKLRAASDADDREATALVMPSLDDRQAYLASNIGIQTQ